MVDPVKDNASYSRSGVLKNRSAQQAFNAARASLGFLAAAGFIGYIMMADHAQPSKTASISATLEP